MADVVVVGGSIVGSLAALMLAGDGHDVTVIEADPASLPDRPADAWDEWDRNGVAQFHQPHNLFPRFREVVDEAIPGLTDALVGAGCARVDPVALLPPTLTDQSPAPGDERMRFVTGRRPVVEAVIATAATNHPGVEVRRGARVAALQSGPPVADGVPHVVGVTLDDGTDLDADLVVDATGRRTKLADWLAALDGPPPAMESIEGGFVYHTRYFTGPELPMTLGPSLMPLGSISILTIPGDNDTWSVTVFGSSSDPVLKRARDPERWSAVVAACPLQAHWLDGRPITDIVTMAGILDRYRRFVVDDQPIATGVAAVGDSWACTNPSTGRGMTVGALHARCLRDAVRAHLDDPLALARAYDELTETTCTPFVHAQFASDRVRLAEMDAIRAGDEPPTDPVTDARMAAMLVEAPVYRAVLETVFCLAHADEAFARPEVAALVEAHAGERPITFPGPDRAAHAELLG
jgi:2-polyprenyl-6-methoxyphenol hydroxylase-like FAD-dependent oxidoreductase